MTAWGAVAACAVGGVVAGPFLDSLARRVRRAPARTADPADPPTDPVAPGAPGAPVVASQPLDPTQPLAEPQPLDPALPLDPTLPLDPAQPLAEPQPLETAPAVPAPPGTEPAGVGASGHAHRSGPAGSSGGSGAAAAAPLPVDVGWSFAVEGTAAAVVTGGLFALAAVRIGAVPQLAAYCALFAALVAVSITDLRTGLVPRRFVYAGLAVVGVGLVAASADAGQWRPVLDALIGGAAGFAVLGAVWWVYPKGMGFGDVRLAALCGAGLGWLGLAPTYLGFLAGFVFGALSGTVVLAVRRTRRFPFAPALAAGTAFGVLWGAWLGNLWLHPG